MPFYPSIPCVPSISLMMTGVPPTGEARYQALADYARANDIAKQWLAQGLDHCFTHTPSTVAEAVNKGLNRPLVSQLVQGLDHCCTHTPSTVAEAVNQGLNRPPVS